MAVGFLLMMLYTFQTVNIQKLHKFHHCVQICCYSLRSLLNGTAKLDNFWQIEVYKYQNQCSAEQLYFEEEKKNTNETIGIKVCFKMQLVKMNSAVCNEKKTWHHSNYKLKD